MEKVFDSWVDGIFGGISPIMNTLTGIIVLILGIVLLISAKKQAAKGKSIAAWVCVVVGFLGTLSGVMQIIIR